MSDPSASVPASGAGDIGALGWFLRGARQVASVPALILMAAFVGFAGLARESGIPAHLAALMTATIWALPSMVVLIGAMKAKASIAAAFVAVSISAVRLMPMTMALVPIARNERSRVPTLLFLSHFVAITAWVFGMSRLPNLPRPARVPFFLGFAVSLTTLNTVVTFAAHVAAGALPTSLAAALTLLMPLYFVMSLWGAARMAADKLALVFGMALAPVMHQVDPDLELLLIGLVGGSAAYFAGRALDRRGPRAGDAAARPAGASLGEGEGP